MFCFGKAGVRYEREKRERNTMKWEYKWQNKKKRIKGLAGILGGLLLLTGCGMQEPLRISVSDPVMMQTVSDENVTPTQQQLLERYVASMTLEEKVGQLFYVTLGNLQNPKARLSNGNANVGQQQINNLQSYQPGGVILMGKNIQSDAQVQEVIRGLQESSTIPLFVGVDEEGGVVSRLGSAEEITMENVGPMRTIGDSGDSQKAYETGVTLGEGLSNLGFNMDFAPDADVLTQAANYEIGNRSFGTDANLVADMVAAEVKGIQEQGVSAVAKHFPGHGDVTGNTHKSLQFVGTSLDQLRTREFLPFAAAIEEDADAILISHLVLTKLETDTPSTLSNAVVTGLLREELGYEGVVITDSFQMGSITDNYTQAEAAVMAVQAGCDMILMPDEYDNCYQGVMEAVQNGTLTKEQIDAACTRILTAKLKRGILSFQMDSPNHVRVCYIGG